MIYLYILKLDYKTYYTGITNNMFRRMRKHRTKKSISTKHATYIELMHIECFKNRKEAHKKEVYIKNKGAKRYLLMTRFANY